MVLQNISTVAIPGEEDPVLQHKFKFVIGVVIVFHISGFLYPQWDQNQKLYGKGKGSSCCGHC